MLQGMSIKLNLRQKLFYHLPVSTSSFSHTSLLCLWLQHQPQYASLAQTKRHAEPRADSYNMYQNHNSDRIKFVGNAQ